MTSILDQPLGDLVVETPAAARIFDRVGLDYCCRGRRTLSQACATAGVDAAAIADELHELDALDRSPQDGWASLGPVALAEHIVTVHHAYLREELPLLSALACKVDGVHAARHPELRETRALVDELRSDLEPHLDKEERVLFPAIRAVVDEGRQVFPFGPLANPIRMMTVEHDRVGELLEELRCATGGYSVPADACASYRSLYGRLNALEHDTHVHVHKENHVLFPAALRAWDTIDVETERGGVAR